MSRCSKCDGCIGMWSSFVPNWCSDVKCPQGRVVIDATAKFKKREKAAIELKRSKRWEKRAAKQQQLHKEWKDAKVAEEIAKTDM